MSKSILLDTGILYSLISADPNDLSQSLEAQDHLRAAILVYDQLVIPPSTLLEIRAILDRSQRNIPPSKTHELKRFLDSDRVTLVNDATVFDNSEQFREKLRAIEAIKGRFSPAMYMDAQLLVTSDSTKTPILTLDRAILQLNSALGEPTLLAPFPFGLEALREVSIYELLELSKPIRRVYSQTLEAVRKKTGELAESMVSINQLKDEISFRGSENAKLKEELLSTAEKEKFWREAARPSSTTMVSWSVLEIALGFLPLPIPTSPITFALDTMRYRRLMKRQSGD